MPNPVNLTNSANLTTEAQLAIDGRLIPWTDTAPRRLTERQRDLMRYVRMRGAIRTRDAHRFYADASAALGRLERHGLVRRTGGGWEATT